MTPDRPHAISIATDLLAPRSVWASYPIRLIAVGGVILIVAIVVATWLLLANLRASQIANSERDLESLSLVLAEQIDRSLQSIEVIQNSLIDHMKSLGIASPADLERQMSGHDTHLRLKDQISALPHIDAIVLTGPNGKLINFSRSWPIPAITTNNSRRDDIFKDPNVTSFVGAARRSPVNGSWVLPIARKITGPNGIYLGAVLGVIRLQYFEQLFQTIARSSDRSISLFTSDRILVARYPDDEKLRGRSFADRGIFTDFLAKGRYGTILQPSVTNGNEILISGRNLPHYPMAVVITKRLDDVLTAWWYAAIYVGGAALIIALMIAGAALYLARKIGRNLQTQNDQLDAALNNMSQGLAMFDAKARLVVCNERYLQMYHLSRELIRRGTTLAELIHTRVANGTLTTHDFADPEQYVASVMAGIARGKATSIIVDLSDGRTIAIANQPMPGGGWVATHEDITEARQREASFRFLFDNNPVPMWVVDRASLRFLAVNNAAVAHYGYSREQFLSMTTFEIRPVEEHERLLQSLRGAGTNLDGKNVWRHLKADGSELSVSIYSRAVNYEGRPARLVAVHDVTDRKLTEQRLRHTQTFLDMIIENVPVPIMVKEIHSKVEDASECTYTLVNRAFEEMLGVSREHIIGKTIAELYPKERAEFIVAENNDALKSEQPVVLSDHPVHTLKNGVRIAIAKSFAVRGHDNKPRYLLTVLQDVTERRDWEQRVSRMAHYDNLTDLPNRITFSDAMEAEFERAAKTGEAFAVLSLDLDGFKEANDKYGHSAGDALLCETSRRLQHAADGAFAARLGGDEFALIITGGAQPETAAAVANRVLEALRDEIVIEGQSMKVGATIGGAIYPKDGSDAKTLMLNADVALYRAKAEARGSLLFFEAEMGNRLRERRALQDDLHSALDRSEFLLHYQPQKRISGETVGFEALLRWQCPNRGLVSPKTFIPIAEEAGSIVTIGQWVLRQACREAASWSQPLTVAVNISPVQFRDNALPETVQAILRETGLAPSRLELEITEGVLVDNFAHAMAILARLKALGIRIALDDFGTGYSSLSYLHAFSFDKIKIDRAFIGDLERNQYSIAIVRAVIDLGHSLDIPILAEGVETAEQHDALFRKGCDEVQGYFIGRPLPIEAYAGLVHRGRAAAARLRIAS